MRSFAKVVFLLLESVVCTNVLPIVRDGIKCGYDSCNPVQDGYINVHLIPHTHDDVGWLKTVDQYYYGAKNDVQKAGVQYILDTVIDSLKRNENRKFTYVETAFFWKWWLEQNDEQKELARKFVNDGQLEFAGGGWSMNDEGATNYQSLIDQMTWGLRKLNDSFGECGRPKTGWQIDPFGHSKGMAYIFALLGYDAFLLNRIDYQDFDHRRETKTLEMVWRSSANLGLESSIFTSVLPKHYNPPSGFCFDINCNDEPIIDDPKSPDNNVERRIDDFISFLDDISSRVSTNNVLITMGDDFTYQNAEMWYKNIDKLIKYINARQEYGSKYNLVYSTPSCYIKAVYDETKGKVNWSIKSDDFLPFADGEHAFLTGYFTSRPTKKKFEREGNNLLQVCKQLSSLTDINPNPNIDYLREAMGAIQHHDAITGTEKQAVAEDYSRMLALGMTYCEEVAFEALRKLSASDKLDLESKQDTSFSTCRLVNISQCAFTESQDRFIVTVYNPLSRPVSKVVRLPVLGTQYSVKDYNGENVVSQLQPIPAEVQKIPGRESEATVDLIFAAKDIPPLGFKSFYIEKTDGYSIVEPIRTVPKGKGILIDETTGLISQVTMNNISIPVTQEFAYYQGYVVPEGEGYSTESGAYVFRPIGPSNVISQSAEYNIYDGPVVTEIHQVFNEWVSQIVRVYADEPYIEFSWLVGPIPDDQYGKEVISRFNTKLKTNSTFYTDSNGRELLERIKDFRPTWDLHLIEEISGNYYPVTSKIVLRDEENKLELSILTDRSQAGSSLVDGEIELMIHRSCLGGDAFGETLQEQAFGKGIVARGSHFLVLGNTLYDTSAATIAASEKDIAQRKLLDAWTFLSSVKGQTCEEYKKDHVLYFTGLTRPLPENVQILTLEPWKQSSFLLRLEHIFEIGEDPTFSQSAVIDLNDLFSTFKIISVKETTLGGNQWLNENQRLYFDESGSLSVNTSSLDATDDIENLKITLNPMQIRTFVAEVELFQ